MSESDEVTARRLEKQTARINLAGAVASLALMAWYLTPEYRRQAAITRARRAARPVMVPLLAAAHRAAARWAMDRELATGVQDYGLSVRLAAARARWEQA